MRKFERLQRMLPAALFSVSLAIPQNLPAQAAAQPPAQAATQPNDQTPAPSATQPAGRTPDQAAPQAANQVSTPAPAHLTAEQEGDTLSAHQRYQAAIAAYSKAPEMTAEIWNKMGINYQMMFNSKDALRCYKDSLQLDPRNPQVLNNLATVYASLKDYGQAERLYRKALKYDPHSALILKNLGTNLLAERRYNKGWGAYPQALAIDPQIFSDRGTPSVQDPSSIQERGAMNYYMAAGCARAGETACALQYLRMALDEGFTTRKKVASDSEFASLRDNPAFKQLLAEQQRSQ